MNCIICFITCFLYVHLLVYCFVPLVSCGSTWLTDSSWPWVKLSIAILFHSFAFRLSGLESHHYFIVLLFAFRGLNHIIVSLLMFCYVLFHYLMRLC
ncbi:hypothetical protein Hanom_Chr03g00234491 [Helianthus anomalus]